MPTGQGSTSKAAAKVENGDYGTSIALNGSGEYNQVHFMSENLSANLAMEGSVFLDGSSAKRSLFPKLKKISGDLVVENHYSGIESFIACLLGKSNMDKSPVLKTTGVYRHFFEPSKDLSARAVNIFEKAGLGVTTRRRLTIGFEKSVSLWENVSSMVNGFTIDIKPERIQTTFNLIPYDQNLDSATNPDSTNWNLPTGSHVKFNQLEVYLKPRDQFTFAASTIRIIEAVAGTVTVSLAAFTNYTGAELSEFIATALNQNATLQGDYRVEYMESERAFKFWTVNEISFSIIQAIGVADLLGFRVTTSQALIHFSSTKALNSYAVFGSTDKVGISSMTLNYSNNLAGEDQDSLSEGKIVEPERNGLFQLTGSIEIPRYKDDEFVKAVNANTTYELLVKFTGVLISGGYYEQLEFFVPSLKFSSDNAQVSGANIIKQSLNFEAYDPTYTDFVNFNFAEYSFNNMNDLSLLDVVSMIEPYKAGIYLGLGTELVTLDEMSGASSALASLASNIETGKQFGSNLYIGLDNGAVYSYNGTSASLSCDFGVGRVKVMEVYNGNLYAAEHSTGKIFKFDGTTWVLSYDSVSVDIYSMVVYNNSLYVLGTDAIGSGYNLYSYNGSAWSLVTTFADDSGFGTLLVHFDELYVFVSAKIFMLNKGTSAWDQIHTGAPDNFISAVSFQGEILTFINTVTDAQIYMFKRNPSSTTGTLTLLGTVTGLSAAGYKPGRMNGHILLQATNILSFAPVPTLMVRMQNTKSTNPLE